MKLYIRLTPKKEKMKGSRGWAVWPFLAIREDVKDNKEILAHEEFHLKQQAAMLFIPWLILYGIFHLKYGYDDNPFEVAAYCGKCRKNPYSWIKYLKK